MNIPAIASFEMALHSAYFVTEFLLAAMIVHDLRGEGRIRAPYVLLLVLTVLQQIAFVALLNVPAWTRFCGWIAGL